MTIDKQKILEEAQRTVARGDGLLMTVRALDVLELMAENDALKAAGMGFLNSLEDSQAENESLRDGVNFRAIQSLRADCEALRKDAERYRWLCDGNGYFLEELGICGHGNEKDQADREIDIAMTEDDQ